MEPQKDIFGPLNGLRGVAALCVVLFHASLIMGRQLAPRGYLAVDLFFVLSGFVIAHAYERRFEAGLGAWTFFVRRLRRFYPLYLTGVAIGAGVMLIDISNPPAVLTIRQFLIALLAGIAFLPVPFASLYPLNVPAWSLLCELLVNLVYGLLWRRTLILALICLVSWALLWFRSIGSPDLVTGLLRAGFSFPVGVFLYRHRLPNHPLQPWLVIAALTSVMVTRFPEMLAITFVFPLGIALLAKSDNAPGFETLGRLSFPLYAIHWPLLQFGLGLSHRLAIHPLLQGFAWIAFCIAAAWAADRWIDRQGQGPWTGSRPRRQSA